MRVLGRVLFASTILIVVFGAVFAILREARRGAPAVDLPLQTRESSAYLVESERELEFRLSGHADQVRLRGHGLIPRRAEEAMSRTYDFAIAIRILAADGTILAQRTEHYRTSVVRHRDPTTGGMERANLVADDTVDVIGTTLTTLDLRHLPEAEVLRVRLAGADPDVRAVGIRVYEPEAVPEHSIAASWQRLSIPQRERLAEGNVYPMPLLSEEETAAIMTRRWRPVGPAGVEGKDYRVQTLFIREVEGAPTESFPVPAGLYVDLHHQGTLTIDEPGRYLIRATAVPESRAAAPEQAMLRLRGTVAQELVLPWTTSTIETEIDLAPGTATLVSDRPAAIRAFRVLADRQVELTPERRLVRAFQLSADSHLDFAVHRRIAGPVLLRMDLRRWLTDPDQKAAAPAAVNYAAIDISGRVIDTGAVRVDAEPAPNDGLADDPTALLSRAVRHELMLMPGVVRLRVTAQRTVYVSMHNRLEGTATATADGIVGGGRTGDWYSFMPIGGADLVRDGKTILIVEGGGLSVSDGAGDAP
jgi:hypothetical protein